MRALPWAVMALLILYRRTWGRTTVQDLDDLRRRLVCSHREVAGYQYENRMLMNEIERLRGNA